MKALKKYLAGIVLTLLFACVFIGMRAEAAAPEKVTGVEQVDASTNNIKVEWNALLANDVDYKVEVSQSRTNWSGAWTKNVTYGNYIYISEGLSAGSTYYVRVQAFNSAGENGAYSDILECVTVPNRKPSYLSKTDSTTSTMTLKWGKVNGANAYVVKYYPTNSSSSVKTKTVDTNYVKLTKLKSNTKYSVYVYPIRRTSNKSFATKANSYYTYEYGLGVTPGKITGVECDYYWQSIKEISVVYKNSNSADGYVAEIWTANKKKDTRIATAAGGSYGADLKKSVLGKHNMIKIRVRGYAKTSSGAKKYGTWSSWTYVCPQPDVTGIACSSKGMKVTWDKISGADRYIVYASTKQKSGYKKVATTTKTSYTMTKWNKKALKKNQKYYFYVVAQKKVGSKYYSGEAGNANYCWYKKYTK